MFMMAFVSWWYSKGWRNEAASFKPRLISVIDTFSVDQLLHTLFAPWRRIISYPGSSLNAKFRAWIDNLFSRTIGFIVRLLVLWAALLALMAVALVSLIELVLWPLLPLSVIGLVVAGGIL